MQINSNSPLTPTLSTTPVTRAPSAPIHVSSEAMPVTLENLAQTLLNKLTNKITVLNPREKEQVKNYLEGTPITEVNDLFPSFKLIMNYIKNPTA